MVNGPALLWPAALPLLAAYVFVRAGDLSYTDEQWIQGSFISFLVQQFSCH